MKVLTNQFLILLLVIFLTSTVHSNASIGIHWGTNDYACTGLPEGSAALAHLNSCIGNWSGPIGQIQCSFCYRGDTDAFMRALTNFAVIKSTKLELVICDGPKYEKFLESDFIKNNDTRVDWKYVVSDQGTWNQLHNNTNLTLSADFRDHKPCPVPRLEVYIGGGGVEWSNVNVPANLLVHDERKKTQ